MKYVELIVNTGNADTVTAIAEKHEVTDQRISAAGEDGMQAIRLLVAAVTMGLMLGNNNINLAMGAGLLLAINLVCVNLACKLVFLIRHISPRTWLEKEKARRAMGIYILIWVLTLAFLMLFIFSQRAVGIAAAPLA